MSKQEAKFLQQNLVGRGFNITVEVDNSKPSEIEIDEYLTENNDVNKFIIKINGFTGVGIRECKFKLSLPVFDKNGVYEINGVKRAIVKRARQDFSNVISKNKSYLVDNWPKVLMDELSTIMCNSLEDFYHNGIKPPESKMQEKVDNFLKTNSICQLIKDTDIAKASIPETIYFKDIIEEGLDVESRKFPDELKGLVDYASTGAGDNINKSYRLVKGTIISKGIKGKEKTGKLLRNTDENYFCSTIQNNAVGIEYNPNRVHLLRAQFEQALDLETPEIPYIRAENNMLQGMHFNTAIMNLGANTYEDAIAFSESAASRFIAIKKHYVRINTSNQVKVNITNGTLVNSFTCLAEETNITGNVIPHYCQNLTFNGKVTSIKRFDSSSYGRDTKKTVIEIEECLPLMAGDKVTTRSGIKGIAVISPDSKMPHLMSNGELVPVDVCISVKCVNNRKSSGTIWEMMANRYAIDNKVTDLISKPFDEPVTYKWLAENGYGKQTQLYIKKKMLPNMTYVDPLLFLRNEKIASTEIKYSGQHQQTTLNNIPTNQSDISGHKLDMANRENIRFKGLLNISNAFSLGIKGRNYAMNLINAARNTNGDK